MASIATVICSYIIYAIRKQSVSKDIEIEGYSKIWISWLILLLQGFLESYISNYIIEIGILIILFVININSLRLIWKSVKNILHL